MYYEKDASQLDCELTDVEIQQLKEHNQRKVKKVVGLVAILLTVLSLCLVAFSLALGSKIDRLVEEAMKKQSQFFSIRANINITEVE